MHRNTVFTALVLFAATSILRIPVPFLPESGTVLHAQQQVARTGGASDSARGDTRVTSHADAASAPFVAAVPTRTILLGGGALSVTAPQRPRIGLVLSGGGARGIAQVGVLRALEEEGIRPDFIVGTSIGAIVGGLYAAGYNARRLDEAIRGIDWNRALRLSDEADRSALSVEQKTISDRSILTLRFEGLQPVLPRAVSNGQRLTNLLNELTLQGLYHSEDFDQLGIPFRAVATDLVSGRSVVLADGSLSECLRASATLPVMYAAVQRDSMMLVDGGLLANIPCHVAADAGCDYIIAVNTTSPMRPSERIGTALEIIDQVFNVVMIPQNDAQLALADAVITPELGTYAGTDFSMIDSLIALGYRAGREWAARIHDDLARRMAASMPRPSRMHDSYVMTPVSAAQHDDPWFMRAHGIDAIYEKAVRTAGDDRHVDVNVRLDHATGRAAILARSVARVTRVRLHGSTVLTAAAMTGIETRWTGQPVSATLERDLREYILEDYRKNGYSLAHIDSIHVASDGSVDVRIDEEIIGVISVVGNTRTNDVVILREIPLRAGEVFRVAAMRRGMENLLALNLFHQVAYDIRQVDGRTNLIIRVVERPSQELLTGLLVDNERNAQIGLMLRDANFLGTGAEIAGTFFSGESNREYRLRYSSNRVFYTPVTARVEGYYGFRDYNHYIDVDGLPGNRFAREVDMVYRTITYGASAAVGLNVERLGNLVGMLRFEQQRIRTDQFRLPDAQPIDENHRLVELSLSTTIDTQDRYPYPRSGILFTAEYASAQTALGSEAAFTRLTTGYEFYLPLIPDILVVHPRMLFGYGDRSMPRTEEFRLSGLSSFIGMRENEFVGRQIARLGIELRYTFPVRILFDTYLSARYDLGRVWENPELIKLEDLRHGVGLQLGLDTPIGAADFGIGRSFYFMERGAEFPIKVGPLNLYFSIGARL
ncbi:MAG: patatin-like phospholipase family protein [Bacteroidota bacterium]|jgi:NTE family protein|nr:patatin-like phospholipase family protein [Bacteroidota bacterium]